MRKEKTFIVSASPKARKFARELGANIHEIKGSERDGRVVEDDIRSFVKEKIRPANSATKSRSPPGARVRTTGFKNCKFRNTGSDLYGDEGSREPVIRDRVHATRFWSPKGFSFFTVDSACSRCRPVRSGPIERSPISAAPSIKLGTVRTNSEVLHERVAGFHFILTALQITLQKPRNNSRSPN